MPHLYELRPLPAEVGGVPITWFDPSKIPEKETWRRYARREKKRLLLPNRPESDFLLIGDSKLLFLDQEPRSSGWRYSFCGMDESPFHAFVTYEAVNAYKEGGPGGFFESLIPPLIKMLRDRSDIPDGYVRQGDWFANRLPFSWEKIEEFVRIGRNENFQLEEVNKESVGGTRHHFTGKVARDVPIFGWKCTLREGVISAPDHSDLVLSGGPHAIAQTANLAQPESAD